MKATIEQNRKQKDFLDKLEVRMGITYERKSYKEESRQILQRGYGFNEPTKRVSATAPNNNVSMSKAYRIEL